MLLLYLDRSSLNPSEITPQLLQKVIMHVNDTFNLKLPHVCIETGECAGVYCLFFMNM